MRPPRGEQLDLFAPPEDERPFIFQVVCHHCDPQRIVAVIPIEGITARWDAAEKFGYVEYMTHLRAAHPQQVPPTIDAARARRR